MFRKATYLGGAAVLVAVTVFGWDALSYLRTSAGRVQESVKSTVPVEFQLDRARKMIESLAPEIRQNMQVIARQEVEVERLNKQIEKMEGRLVKDRTDLTRLTADLGSGKTVFYYAGRRYSGDQVKIDLANRLKRVKTNDETLINLTKVRDARERGLSAARQKLEQMLAVKRQLIVSVNSLAARQKMVEVAQTASEDCHFDDSRLSKTKELVSDIETRIEVDERLVNVESDFHDEIPLDVEVNEDIVDQVTRYLGIATPETEAVAEIQ